MEVEGTGGGGGSSTTFTNPSVFFEGEEDWSEDLARHLVEIVMEDHVLARERPSKIAHAVYHAIKVSLRTLLSVLSC